jgi:hypothetical protein
MAKFGVGGMGSHDKGSSRHRRRGVYVTGQTIGVNGGRYIETKGRAAVADKTYYKILLPMKRKPGMSVEAFRDYYENHHAPYCAQFSGAVSRYIRRYLDAHPHPENGLPEELPYDVITELWFEDEAVFKGTLAYLTSSIMPDEVVADERNLFDRSSFRIVTVTERETDLDAVRQAAEGGA